MSYSKLLGIKGRIDGWFVVNTGKRKKTTIYDIAKRAGTSSATVSLVLNGTWKKNRIGEDTAKRVMEIAAELDYKLNMRARGLRLSQSGLAGMIIPHYRNRFFADLAEAFESETRAHKLCPVVISTQRDSTMEQEVVEALLSQQVEFIFIAGVHRPEVLNQLCHAAGTPCVNLDLPGEMAPSVVSDSRSGAFQLTKAIIENMLHKGRDVRSLRFVGGNRGDYATEERLIGFKSAAESHGIAIGEDHIHRCGYSPDATRETTRRLVDELGGLPEGLFINSLTALEGFIGYTSEVGVKVQDRVTLGCFDWDPFAAVLPYSILMMRQDTGKLVKVAFEQVLKSASAPYDFIKIPTIFQVGGNGTFSGSSQE